jgi:hypothetical protein
MPELVTGSLPHPTFTPDAQALAKMKLNNLLPTTGDPGKLRGGLLGQKGARGHSKRRTRGWIGAATTKKGQQKQPQQQNPVDSLLKQLPKKKK